MLLDKSFHRNNTDYPGLVEWNKVCWYIIRITLSIQFGTKKLRCWVVHRHFILGKSRTSPNLG